ncbi:MAG: flagellar protein FlaG [Lachnospiraceae bacterium]|jgi:flagellar protein FlaG|nr:flagellar protein FlaG [Lachnospiraceae bacterium]
MAIEPLGSVMTIQSQSVQKPVKTSEVAENKEVSTPAQVTNVDPVTVSVSKADNKDGQSAGNQNAEQQQAANEKVKKAVEQLNRNMPHSEAVFGIHDGTNRVMIKIVDKDTKEVIKEFPPEETLDMIEKVWELAGIMVDERR